MRGARTHNLKSLDIDIPRDQLIVITGLSGSGKSSLAFDTIYAEGQRRYVESLSTYARQFLSVMEKPDVDTIEGLSPAISIEQKSTSHNPRSTVGTVTEVHDYLRLLFARVGDPRCPEHGTTLDAQTVTQMVDNIMRHPESSRIMILAPVVSNRKGEFQYLFGELFSQGYIRAIVDGIVSSLETPPELDKNLNHDIDIIVDRLVVKPDNRQRLAESLESAISLSGGTAKIAILDDERNIVSTEDYSSLFACPHCGYSLDELEPRLFSFNSPVGACTDCDGIGTIRIVDPEKVVRDPHLSIAQGAIPGWDQRYAFYHVKLVEIAKYYGFDLDLPFENLEKEWQDIILFGNRNREIQFADRDYSSGKPPVFEGIVNNLERRYNTTDSSHSREELSRYMSTTVCKTCNGARLKPGPRHVYIADSSIDQVSHLPVNAALEFFSTLKLEGRRAEIAEKIIKEIVARLGFLNNVGLNYLTLSRSAETLSGGEAQRIRLASQIGSGLVGVMYILDEPSIGLHQRDNTRLLDTLFHLRDLGNTVIVVEHDEEAIRSADFVIDIGPGAGKHGGAVVAQGKPKDIADCKHSITGQYLSGKASIPVPVRRHSANMERILEISGASGNNLKNITAKIPIGLLTCVTGVSGSGKSTLINNTLYPALAKKLRLSASAPEPYANISGLEYLDKVIVIDQSPIGRTPRSNPATYAGLFTPIRDLFTATPESRTRGYKVGRFSFNVRGGRCESCQGDGLIRVEMHFLPDIYVPCDLCKGERYNRETLEIKYKGKNISEVLKMTVEEASEFFSAIPAISRKLETLLDVGLGYITLGQSAITLSGGEAQRVKLSKELSKRDTGRTLYILDEPTTGLHFQDVRQLLNVLHRLRDQGNTVIVIEHNLDVIKTADWIIDLGPEGGDQGGEIVAMGSPEKICQSRQSYTGEFLVNLINTGLESQIA